MRTYRLQITSQDFSAVQLNDSGNAFSGFTTIKAARGTTTPLFIPTGNESYIMEQFGAPSASFPDVQEVIDFNRRHPVYVSAPAGVEVGDLRNTHGAMFVTAHGIYTGTITASGAQSTVQERDVTFNIGQALDTFQTESSTANPSMYTEFEKVSKEYSPVTFNQGSVISTTFTYGSTEETVMAIASEDWTERAASSVTDDIPTDSDVLVTDSFEGVIDGLETSQGTYFTDNPDRFRFLRKYDGSITGRVIGFMYAVEDTLNDNRLKVTIRLYPAVQRDDAAVDAATSTWGDTSSDPLHIDNNFFQSFTTGTTAASRQSLSWDATVTAIAMIYQKFATETRTSINIRRAPRTDAADNFIVVGITDFPSRNVSINERTYEISFDEAAKDGYGTSRYIDDVIRNDRVIVAKSLVPVDGPFPTIEDIDPLTDANLSAEGITVDIRGERAIGHLTDEADIVASLTQGWEESKASEYDNVVIFFAPTGYDGMDGVMAGVRSTHKFSRCVVPALRGKSRQDVEADGVDTLRNALEMDHGLVYPINEIRTTDARSGTSWWRFPVGAYSDMLVRIMRQKNGAWAPMFENDGGNLGGQLDATFDEIRMKYIPQELQRELDDSVFNTMIYDPDYGLMMINQRTGQNPNTINDSSWLSHDMAFDLWKRLVQREVMFPQIGKPIDAQYIGLRTRQLQSRAARFGNAFNAIRIEVDSVNTDETRAQRRFQMATSVQVTPFSEFVDFFFYNVGQEASVDDPFDN